MIFWTPDALAARLSWEAEGGYKVNYQQQGSAMALATFGKYWEVGFE